jgi:hypothetical protein
MRLAFLIIAHDHPQNLLRLASRLSREGDLVVIHWDKKSTFDIREFLRHEMSAADYGSVLFSKRFDVQWGRWSMVEATLGCLEQVMVSGREVDYVILLSGADYPIRPLSHLKAFLQLQPDREYIECVDPDNRQWIVRGLSKERYEYRHWVNWRTHPKLFDMLYNAQRRLGLKRRMPDRLKAYFGSQWWALTWKTASEILERSKIPRIRRFFKTTWVPDELFFQTMTAAIAPAENIGPCGLTFYHFTPQGLPVVFYNDHFKFLKQQEFFFARKISPYAEALRNALDSHMDSTSGQQLPEIRLRKRADQLNYFLNMQWRSIPNTRIIGRVVDPWYGDLEWNRLPYFVILAPEGANLEPLRDKLNLHPGIRCYGDLFDPYKIDYALPGAEHPSYPENDCALRDMKRPNFLCDVIHLDPKKVAGCIMRVPPHHEMVDVAIYDPRALIVVCLPDDAVFRFMNPDDTEYQDVTSAVSWKRAFDGMTSGDRLLQIQKTGKNPVVVRMNGYHITEKQAESVARQILKQLKSVLKYAVNESTPK